MGALDWRAMAEAAKSARNSLAERLLAGDKRALARAISLVENREPDGDRLVAELFPRTGNARVVGVTGPPGVGKSTLIGALTAELRKADRDVGVLSIDPSSPFTQGAMLGDRIRLADHFLDPGVFIRSMATRGSLGGLAEAALQAALLMDAAGKDDVLLETVGVGQGEVDVVDHADTIVLALMPGSGDSIQALKAGVMEIPDVIVVNKSEHPLADTMVREVRSVLALGPQGAWKVPVVRTEASKGRGISELLDRIDAHRRHIEDTGSLAERRARNLRAEVLGIAAARLRRGLEERAGSDPEWESLLDSVVRRETDPATAARRLLDRAGREQSEQERSRRDLLLPAPRAPSRRAGRDRRRSGRLRTGRRSPESGAPRRPARCGPPTTAHTARMRRRAARRGARARACASIVFLSMGPPVKVPVTEATLRRRSAGIAPGADNQAPIWALGCALRPRLAQRSGSELCAQAR